jgi:predicted protein tyrosine phosphatase
MEFFVYSRDVIARVAPHDVPHVIVSITSGETDVARFPIPATCRGVLRLVFADLEPRAVDASSRALLFDEEHARRIWTFVLAHRSAIERIVVHCDAGRSRSPAVAAALALAFGEDHETFFRQYTPNRHVYETLLATRPA